jgi:hypothetical protein
MEIYLKRKPIVYPDKYHQYHKAIDSDFEGYSQKGEEVTLFYKAEKDSIKSETILKADEAYVDVDNIEYIKTNILAPAREIGQAIINSFAAENILLGITQYGKTNDVRKACSQITDALTTGSLYDAIAEARNIPSELKDSIFLTDARLLGMINKIETYLGKPLSTKL